MINMKGITISKIYILCNEAQFWTMLNERIDENETFYI